MLLALPYSHASLDNLEAQEAQGGPSVLEVPFSHILLSFLLCPLYQANLVDPVDLIVPLFLGVPLGHWDLVIHSVHAGQGLLSVLSSHLARHFQAPLSGQPSL